MMLNNVFPIRSITCLKLSQPYSIMIQLHFHKIIPGIIYIEDPLASMPHLYIEMLLMED